MSSAAPKPLLGRQENQELLRKKQEDRKFMRELLQSNAEKSLQVLMPQMPMADRPNETTERVAQFLQEGSYRKLILDAYNSVNILLQVEHGLLD